MAARKPVQPRSAGGVELPPTPLTGPIEGELVTLKAVTPKAGVKTTEFWQSLGTIVVLLLPLFHVVAAPATVKVACAAAVALVSAVYSIVRSNVKTAHAQQARALPPIES